MRDEGKTGFPSSLIPHPSPLQEEMRCKATPTGRPAAGLRRGRRAPRPPGFMLSSESAARPGGPSAARTGRNPRPAASGPWPDGAAGTGPAGPPPVRRRVAGRTVPGRRGGRRPPPAPGTTTLARTGPCATQGDFGCATTFSWLVLVPAALPATPPRELPEKLRTSCQRLRSSTHSRPRDREAGNQFHTAHYAGRTGVWSTKKAGGRRGPGNDRPRGGGGRRGPGVGSGRVIGSGAGGGDGRFAHFDVLPVHLIEYDGMPGGVT